MTQTMAQDKSQQELGNMRFISAQDVFRDLPQIAEDMEATPDPEEGALDFLARLAGGPTPEDALTFAAYLLRPRHSVWWAHECLRIMEPWLQDQDRAMMALAAAWVGDPSETTRYEALEAAEANESKTPGVWLAHGVGWSGGSMAPADLPPVPPARFLVARAVNIAVLGILARCAAHERGSMREQFISMAGVLARGE